MTDSDPAQKTMLPPPSQPMDVARVLVASDLPVYRAWRGSWMRWDGTRWVEADVASLRSWLYARCESAYYMTVDKSGNFVEKPWAPTRTKIADLLEACAAILHLESSVSPPCWLLDSDLASSASVPSPISLVACANGLLSVPTRALYYHSPAFFNLVSVPFAYSPDALCPTWLSFLDSCWPSDYESIETLQQWFGYVLSGRTNLHKILLIHGERRSGKGTIARVLTALLGSGNVAGPTLASFQTNFGASMLIGKPLGIIGDARLRGTDTSEVVERLLSISGEDVLGIDRKYRDPWVGTLPTRLMILSNELPAFGDASGTIVSRLVTLTMARSWAGMEDTTLHDRLMAELPGILNWSLAGIDSLNAKGRLTEPASSIDAVADLADSVSPLSVFLRDCCVVSDGLECSPHDLYLRWRSWCFANGRSERQIGTVQSFGRNLRSVLPGVQTHRTNDGVRTYLGIGLKQVDMAQLMVNGGSN